MVLCCVCSCSVSGFLLAAVLQFKVSSPGCCSQDQAIWLDWVHYNSKYQALVAQAAAWSPVISLTGAALSPLFSSQALPRPVFDHPPVLQQTALSYCLDSHFSPVNLCLVIKRHSLDYSASGSLSSKLVWQNPDNIAPTNLQKLCPSVGQFNGPMKTRTFSSLYKNKQDGQDVKTGHVMGK